MQYNSPQPTLGMLSLALQLYKGSFVWLFSDLMKCSVEHETLSITTVMFCEREKTKVIRIIIQQNDKSTQEYHL